MSNIFDALRSSGGQPTIFNAQGNVQAATLSKQMQNSILGEGNKQTLRIQAEYDTKVQKQNFEKDRWTQHNKLIEDAQDIINNNFTRLEGIYSTLDRMLNTINSAENSQNDPDSNFRADGYSATFDSQLKSIYSSADESRVTTNLLNSDSRELDYPISFNGVLSKVGGADIRPSYYITDSDGKRWQVETDTKLLRQYDSYPDAPVSPSKVASFNRVDSLVLNGISGDDVTFTTSANTADAVTRTGTLNRSGLEILNSWLYGNFSTSEGRNRAREDIAAAKEALFLEKARYAMVKTTLNYHSDVATAQIRDIRDETLKIQQEGQRKVADVQDELVRKYKAAQSALAQKFSLKASLSALIPSGSSNNPVMQILMDINA
ncbi:MULTISPECIES: hypothetical protein [Pseudomonadati]|uniref:hypothetical protein n=1 Tax=Pseudomonadati TaxID=3379134 RepID=UPI003AA7EF92